MIYFDSAATTLQKPGMVGAAMQKAVSGMSSPGRGGHSAAMRAADTAFKTRESAAKLFCHSDPEAVVFCMNATHALNIAVNSLVRQGERAVISGYEHNSVVRPLYALGADVFVARSQLFDVENTLEVFDHAINANTKLVVVNHCSNVFGFILPIYEISRMCRERGVPLIIDASQSAGVISIDFEKLDAAFIAMPGHKGLYGPQGTGILLCGTNLCGGGKHCGAKVKPYMFGGSGSSSRLLTMPDFLPDMLEAGTHNMPGIAGLHEGIKFVTQKTTETILKHERTLLRQTIKHLSAISAIKMYYAEDENLQSGVLSFTVKGMESEELASKLSEKGIAVRAGLHCAPIAHETAGTIESGTVRISFSAFNTLNEVSRLALVLRQILR